MYQADVENNNINNNPKLEPVTLSNGKVPDGVGQPGQVVTIREKWKIDPNPDGTNPDGRVIVESDHTVHNGTMPDSEAREQVRAFREADPNATLVVTDCDNPTASPLVYPPGAQPPPPGHLPPGTSPSVPYP